MLRKIARTGNKICVDSSVPLMNRDPKDLGLICLEKKCKIHIRILSDLRIQSWIFLKKRTLSCQGRKQKRKNQPIKRPRIEHCHWFILLLLLATPTMQFSLDHKRRSHKQSRCSAYDSVGLIFTRSYRSRLLITTPTTTPSLVKTSLK